MSGKYVCCNRDQPFRRNPVGEAASVKRLVLRRIVIPASASGKRTRMVGLRHRGKFGQRGDRDGMATWMDTFTRRSDRRVDRIRTQNFSVSRFRVSHDLMVSCPVQVPKPLVKSTGRYRQNGPQSNRLYALTSASTSGETSNHKHLRRSDRSFLPGTQLPCGGHRCVGLAAGTFRETDRVTECSGRTSPGSGFEPSRGR